MYNYTLQNVSVFWIETKEEDDESLVYAVTVVLIKLITTNRELHIIVI